MPLVYSTEKEVEGAKTALEIHCVDIKIRIPREGDQTITYYFEAVDSDGNVVEKKPIHVPLSQVQSEKPIDYETAFGILKTDAYERALIAYPAGTVV